MITREGLTIYVEISAILFVIILFYQVNKSMKKDAIIAKNLNTDWKTLHYYRNLCNGIAYDAGMSAIGVEREIQRLENKYPNISEKTKEKYPWYLFFSFFNMFITGCICFLDQDGMILQQINNLDPQLLGAWAFTPIAWFFFFVSYLINKKEGGEGLLKLSLLALIPVVNVGMMIGSFCIFIISIYDKRRN